MPKKLSNQIKIRIFSVVVIILVICVVVFWYNVPLRPLLGNVGASVNMNVGLKTDSVVSNHLLAIGESIGVPVNIKIPSIKVDAVIEKVGLKTDGSMGVPKQPLDAGWYELGPRPGEIGSAAIDGHVNWYYGATGVFADLRKVKPGDKITVQDDKGAIISFVVRGSRMYAAAADATDVFKSSDGKAHLNLITCDGVWDKNAKQYSKRLVIFADKE
jgi:sortase (surface protein transpeptidase)